MSKNTTPAEIFGHLQKLVATQKDGTTATHPSGVQYFYRTFTTRPLRGSLVAAFNEAYMDQLRNGATDGSFLTIEDADGGTLVRMDFDERANAYRFSWKKLVKLAA